MLANAMGVVSSASGSPFRSRKQYLPFGKPNFSRREIAAVSRVLRGGWIGMGPLVQEFERALSNAVEAPFVVTVNSCTSALFLALKLHGVGPGDDVVVPSLTWCSTANAALYLGATPVFCDVDPATLCATPDTVAEALTRRTKAVIIVHFGGRSVDTAAMRAVLPPSTVLVEDAAHAFGGRYPNGRPVGSSGNSVCFSFYANKNLSTGEGGALALFDEAMAQRALSLRQHGLHADAWKRYCNPSTFMPGDVDEVGYKMNFTDLQAAIGLVQLERQPFFSRRRLGIARHYTKALRTLAAQLEPLEGQTSPFHARHLFVVRDLHDGPESRNALFLELRRRNVGVSLHYSPLHRMSVYHPFATRRLPATDGAADRILTLPISSSMTTEDAAYVIEALRDCL